MCITNAGTRTYELAHNSLNNPNNVRLSFVRIWAYCPNRRQLAVDLLDPTRSYRHDS